MVKPKVHRFVNAFQQHQHLKSGTRQLKSHELAYFGVGGTTQPSRIENSSSYRNGYSSAQKYDSSDDDFDSQKLKTLNDKRNEVVSNVFGAYDRKTDLKRDEAILDELTKASEEILNVRLILSC